MPQSACRSAWARLIAKVYEVDPLVCPRCGSEMKLIAVITNPAEVAKVLRQRYLAPSCTLRRPAISLIGFKHGSVASGSRIVS